MLALRAAGFMATSTLGESPGVEMSWSEMWTWKADTPARVPAGARISAGKSGKVARSFPSRAEVVVKRSPASCMPSPESPAKRMTTRSTGGVISVRWWCRTPCSSSYCSTALDVGLSTSYCPRGPLGSSGHADMPPACGASSTTLPPCTRVPAISARPRGGAAGPPVTASMRSIGRMTPGRACDPELPPTPASPGRVALRTATIVSAVGTAFRRRSPTGRGRRPGWRG